MSRRERLEEMIERIRSRNGREGDKRQKRTGGKNSPKRRRKKRGKPDVRPEMDNRIPFSLTNDTWGENIPVFMGNARIPGYVIWVKENKIGATATFAVAFGASLRGRRQRGVKNIWANGRRLYHTADDNEPFVYVGSLRDGGTFKFYPGNETQDQDPDIVADRGADKTPAHRGLMYMVVKDLPLDKYGGTIPGITAHISDEIRATNEPNYALTDEAIIRLSRISDTGFNEKHFSFVGTDMEVRGILIRDNFTFRDALATFARFIGFDFWERGQGLAFKKAVDDDGNFTIDHEVDADELVRDSAGPAMTLTRIPEPDLPRSVTVGYIDVSQQFSKAIQRARLPGFPLAYSGTQNDSFDVPIITDASTAMTGAARALYRDVQERNAQDFTLPPTFLHAEPGDIVRLTYGNKIYTSKIVGAVLGADFSTRCELINLSVDNFTITFEPDVPEEPELPPCFIGTKLIEADFLNGSYKYLGDEVPIGDVVYYSHYSSAPHVDGDPFDPADIKAGVGMVVSDASFRVPGSPNLSDTIKAFTVIVEYFNQVEASGWGQVEIGVHQAPGYNSYVYTYVDNVVAYNAEPFNHFVNMGLLGYSDNMHGMSKDFERRRVAMTYEKKGTSIETGINVGGRSSHFMIIAPVSATDPDVLTIQAIGGNALDNWQVAIRKVTVYDGVIDMPTLAVLTKTKDFFMSYRRKSDNIRIDYSELTGQYEPTLGEGPTGTEIMRFNESTEPTITYGYAVSRHTINQTDKIYWEYEIGSFGRTSPESTDRIVEFGIWAVNESGHPDDVMAPVRKVWMQMEPSFIIPADQRGRIYVFDDASSGIGGEYTGFNIPDVLFSGDRVMVAVDGSTGKVWFGSKGVWLGNPAAGTGEQAILNFSEGGMTYRPGIMVQKKGGDVNLIYQENFFKYKPAGFRSILNPYRWSRGEDLWDVIGINPSFATRHLWIRVDMIDGSNQPSGADLHDLGPVSSFTDLQSVIDAANTVGAPWNFGIDITDASGESACIGRFTWTSGTGNPGVWSPAYAGPCFQLATTNPANDYFNLNTFLVP